MRVYKVELIIFTDAPISKETLTLGTSGPCDLEVAEVLVMEDVTEGFLVEDGASI